MNSSYKLIAVIPAFNEEASIGDLISFTKKYVDRIIVCNDGSEDMTAKIVSKLGVNIISHKKRKGKGNALRVLFKEAIKFDPDVIITLDADGQHIPSEIPKLINPIILGESDMVVGSRFLNGSETDISFLRNIGLRIINSLQKCFFPSQIYDAQSGFRAFSKIAFSVVLESYENNYGIESEQLIIALKNGIRVSEVPVNIKYCGLQNTSKKNFILHGIELVFMLFKHYMRSKKGQNIHLKY